MIKLEVKDYCHDCPYFEPDVEKPDKILLPDGRYITLCYDTIVRCERRDSCEHVKNFCDNIHRFMEESK